MIAWILTVHSRSVATDLVADVADDRNTAITSAADALRNAVLDAGRSNRCDEPAPLFVVTMDREEVASIVLSRTELGKLAIDDALDCIERFEATRINSRTVNSEAAARWHSKGVVS